MARFTYHSMRVGFESWFVKQTLVAKLAHKAKHWPRMPY